MSFYVASSTARWLSVHLSIIAVCRACGRSTRKCQWAKYQRKPPPNPAEHTSLPAPRPLANRSVKFSALVKSTRTSALDHITRNRIDAVIIIGKELERMPCSPLLNQTGNRFSRLHALSAPTDELLMNVAQHLLCVRAVPDSWENDP